MISFSIVYSIFLSFIHSFTYIYSTPSTHLHTHPPTYRQIQTPSKHTLVRKKIIQKYIIKNFHHKNSTISYFFIFSLILSSTFPPLTVMPHHPHTSTPIHKSAHPSKHTHTHTQSFKHKHYYNSHTKLPNTTYISYHFHTFSHLPCPHTHLPYPHTHLPGLGVSLLV